MAAPPVYGIINGGKRSQLRESIESCNRLYFFIKLLYFSISTFEYHAGAAFSRDRKAQKRRFRGASRSCSRFWSVFAGNPKVELKITEALRAASNKHAHTGLAPHWVQRL
jgi:hypothetical protein